MKRYYAALAVFIIAAGYSAYEFLFFAWVTATPVTAEQLTRAQNHAKMWFLIFCISLLLAAAIVVLAIMASIKGKKRTTINAS
jgi:hypothetical protein